jgi:NodT family efflux transporter outer membrane factor (OMF) lipoprotein
MRLFIDCISVSRIARREAGASVRSGHTPPLFMRLAIATTVLLAGCASTISTPLPKRDAQPVATQWHAPLPHGGQLTDLSQWWAQFDDPLMLRLIEAGQQVSPTVAQASARIADARAARVSSRAARMPSLGAGTEASRGRQAFGSAGPMSVATLSTAGLQASWELDLFGASRAATNAAQARLESSEAGWHDARVSVAAEIATTYVELRACEAQVRQAELDAKSRVVTSLLTSLAAEAGFQAPAAVHLANASAAQGHVTLLQQRAQCDLLVKALNALTAQDETALRHDLVAGTGLLRRPAELQITSIPAEVLAQRPDIHAAARDVIAASAEFNEAQARRWPRIALAGNIGTTFISSGGVSTDGTVWSIGPVTVTLPLFDGGTRRANAEAARARYDAAAIIYSARLREAIRDVESALVMLDSTAKRSEGALIAVQGFKHSYSAIEASYEAGIANLFDLEDARRGLVAAQSAMIELQRERISAWIALYRALGGGWSSATVHKAPEEASPDDVTRMTPPQ